MSKFTIIRYVDDGAEDYEYLSACYQKGDYQAIFNHLKEWDYGEPTEESEPKLALYDQTLYQDETYLLVYNATIGGTFALFAKQHEAQ